MKKFSFSSRFSLQYEFKKYLKKFLKQEETAQHGKEMCQGN